MKEATGGIPIFQIVIIFLVLFAGIMALTINRSKAFGVKDEIISIIQNNEVNNNSILTISDDTVEAVLEKLDEAGYRITGTCEDGYTGYDRNKREVQSGAVFCVRTIDASSIFYDDALSKCRTSGVECYVSKGGYPSTKYYDIVLFYQLDIPGLNRIMNFRLKGSTKVIYGG